MKKILLVLLLLFSMSAVSFAGDILPNGFTQEDQYSYMVNLKNSIMNGCYGDAGLGIAAGASSMNVLTTTTVSYTVNGVWHQLVPSASISISSDYVGTIAAQPVSTYCKYLVSVASTGEYAISKGNVVAYSALSVLPELPSGYAAIGYFQVATGASATYTPGTTTLNATGVTTTYVDLRAVNSGKSAVSLTGL